MGAGCFHVGVRALIEETAPQIEVVMDIDAHDVYARMRTMLSVPRRRRKEGSGKNMPHRYSGLPKALDTVAILG
jgi:hypothetical protein